MMLCIFCPQLDDSYYHKYEKLPNIIFHAYRFVTDFFVLFMFQPIMLKQLNSLDMFSCLGSLEWYYNTTPLSHFAFPCLVMVHPWLVTVCPCDNSEVLLIRQELNHQIMVPEVQGLIPRSDKDFDFFCSIPNIMQKLWPIIKKSRFRHSISPWLTISIVRLSLNKYIYSLIRLSPETWISTYLCCGTG